MLFAYEEAIGFMVNPAIPDKDGVSAAVLIAELAHKLALEGKTLSHYLEDIYKRFDPGF